MDLANLAQTAAQTAFFGANPHGASANQKANASFANFLASDESAASAAFAGEAASMARDVLNGASFKEAWKNRFSPAFYSVMDTAKIDGGAWGRNDYPWDAYFRDGADESAAEWRPSGGEPAMTSPRVQSAIERTIGKKALVLPPGLEAKMANDPRLASEVAARVEDFVAAHEREGAAQGFLITLDGEGQIAHACVTSAGRVTTSSSDFADAARARRERLHAESEARQARLNEREIAAQATLQKIIEREKAGQERADFASGGE